MQSPHEPVTVTVLVLHILTDSHCFSAGRRKTYEPKSGDLPEFRRMFSGVEKTHRINGDLTAATRFMRLFSWGLLCFATEASIARVFSSVLIGAELFIL